MNYEQMTQLALRGVVRDAVRRVIREDGLPGAHHFYITFLTRYPGVEIDAGLAAKYPEEITIVLEHQYWDLNAYETEFEVTLKFGGIPKYLKVPYHAITRFHDPSVGFALQFDPPPEMDESETVTQIPPAKPSAAAPKTKALGTVAKKTIGKAKTTKPDSDKPASKKPAEEKKSEKEGKKVISLDSFRKK